MRLPNSTYRLQLNADFRLADVRGLLDYFQALGISDLYLSPLLQARAGSTHGYDVIDPSHVNREIGTDEEFDQLAAAMHTAGMGILLDIVPNHMSATEVNPWWRDVLENGAMSPFARFFDIHWETGTGRLLLPFLDQPLDQCIEQGKIRVVLQDGELAIASSDRVLPIDPASIPFLLTALRDVAADLIPPEADEALAAIAAAAAHLPTHPDAHGATERRQRARELKAQLARVLAQLPGDLPGRLRSDQLRRLLEKQPYALFNWVEDGRQVNYRRFFDISDLAGLRIEDRDVFLAVHQRVIPWLMHGVIAGVRVDHIDGLRDPARYLCSLRQEVAAATGEPPYVVVEKILIADERLPADWCASGTTGYDFIGIVNGLFVEPGGWARISAAYQMLAERTDFTQLVHDKKRQVMHSLFPGELSALVERLSRLLPRAASEALEFALVELTASLTVYRTYITCTPGPVDTAMIDQALTGARRRGADAAVSQWLRDLLLDPQNDEELDFILRWQQFTGPVMAKGLEDTAFYNDCRLISTCEVGADPRYAVCSAEQFHEHMQRRQADWPGTLNSTSTHDTKRSEDVRARINVLSELADEWLERVARWQEIHAPLRRRMQDIAMPDPQDELLLYQTLVGAWPLTQHDADAFTQRIRDFMLKAVREAKRRTSWLAPHQDYEQAVLAFTDRVLATDNREFLNEFRELERKTSFYGALNSLSQLVLKLGAPGVPDFYQGTELWSLHLVDPDNRKPVDYHARRNALAAAAPLPARQHWRAGRVKALMTARGLQLRNRLPELFARGDYIPVTVEGPHARNVVAFERALNDQRILFVTTRFFSELVAPEQWPVGDVWTGTQLRLKVPPSWRDALTGRDWPGNAARNLSIVLEQLPFAMLAWTG